MATFTQYAKTVKAGKEATYLKAASEVEVGEIVCEPDGFAFYVTASDYNNGRYTFTLVPMLSAPGTARTERTCTVKRSASIRVAA